MNDWKSRIEVLVTSYGRKKSMKQKTLDMSSVKIQGIEQTKSWTISLLSIKVFDSEPINSQ